VYLCVGLLGLMVTVVPVSDPQTRGYRFFQEPSGAFALWFLAVNLTAIMVLPLRRRFPVGVALVGWVALVTSAGWVPFGLALFALAIRRRDAWLWVVTGCGVAAWALHLSLPPVMAVLVAVMMTGLPLAAGAYLGARRDLVASLRERADEAEQSSALRADQARLAERTRIAQEMHDVLAHRISLVALHAGGLEVRPDVRPEDVARSAALIGSTARAALADLRDVLGLLRTDTSAEGADLAPQPRLADLPRLVATSAAAGIRVRLDWRLSAAPAEIEEPPLIGRTVYRVVQEALTNVHKHARDAATTVVLSGCPGTGLVVEITNVRPVAADALVPGAGVGLVGLRERVELAGGTFEAGPLAGGWRVRAGFGWPPDRPGERA